MGLFSGKSTRDPSVVEMENWLAHPMEFGRKPDKCSVIKQYSIKLPGVGDSLLSLCRYRYNDRKADGRGVAGASTWSFIGDDLNEIPDDDYMLAYCGWYVVFNGVNSGSVQVKNVNENIQVPGHRTAVVDEIFILGDSIVYSYSGVTDRGDDVVGATDGSFTVCYKKAVHLVDFQVFIFCWEKQ